MLQCLMFQEIGFEQCEGTWFWIVLQGLRWQAGPRWQPQDLHWCHQDFPRRRQGVPKVIEFTFYAPSSDSNLFYTDAVEQCTRLKRLRSKTILITRSAFLATSVDDSWILCPCLLHRIIMCTARYVVSTSFKMGYKVQKFCIFPGMLQSCDSSWQASNLHGYGSNCRWRWERRMPSMQRKSFRGWKDDNQKWIVP